MEVDTNVMGHSDLHTWQVRLTGAPGTLYEGEHFKLQFKFSPKYPFDSPEVTFTGENIPLHPHIYSNGHICLSILTDDWSPALSVQAVCLSIISMLSSCKEKKRPPDDAFYVKTCSKNPKKTKWWYHDDTVWPCRAVSVTTTTTTTTIIKSSSLIPPTTPSSTQENTFHFKKQNLSFATYPLFSNWHRHQTACCLFMIICKNRVFARLP